MKINKYCILCNSTKIQKRIGLSNITVFWCQKCDSGFLPHNERITVSKLYTPEYFNIQLSNIHDFYLNKFKPPISQKKGYKQTIQNLKFIVNLCKEYSNKRKLLDIGSATGIFLHLAKKQGFKVTGIEPSAYAAKIAQSQLNIPTTVNTFENVKIKSKYNVVTLLDVVEHLSEPKKVINKIKKNLSENGLLIVTTPNYASLITFIVEWLYKISFKLISGPVKRFFMPEHYFYFTKRSIENLVENSGFEIIRSITTESAYEIVPMSYIQRKIIGVIFLFGRILNLQNRTIIVARKS